MKRRVIFLGIAFAALCSSCTSADRASEPVKQVVPLEKIWAYKVPGTRDVRDLEPGHFGKHIADLPGEQQLKLLHGSLVQQIIRSLIYLRKEEKLQAQPAFAVSGDEQQALKQAHSVLVNKEIPPNTFLDRDEIYIVFFSHMFGSYVRLNEVVRKGTSIEIKYQFVPHSTKDLTSHFAMIPIDKLPVGKYTVKIVQAVSNNERPIVAEIESRVVCHPFSFEVVE